MYQLLKQRIRNGLVNTACGRFGLQADLSDLSHPLPLIKNLGMTCRGLIHVGAHFGEEFESYREAGLDCVVYIEAVPEIFAALKEHVSIDPRHHPVQAVCTERSGDEIEFNIASNDGASSSILALGSHALKHPEIAYRSKIKLRSTTLDDIIFGTPAFASAALDCLVMDVQGAEMKVVRGAHRTLAQCRYVFTEINEGGLYEGNSSYAKSSRRFNPTASPCALSASIGMAGEMRFSSSQESVEDESPSSFSIGGLTPWV